MSLFVALAWQYNPWVIEKVKYESFPFIYYLVKNIMKQQQEDFTITKKKTFSMVNTTFQVSINCLLINFNY